MRKQFMKYSIDVLKIDPETETEKVCDFILEQTRKVYHRNGVIVGLSGGVDSAVMAALAVKALGKERVVGCLRRSPIL